jgi:cob(I)alamin adenosyltransferase
VNVNVNENEEEPRPSPRTFYTRTGDEGYTDLLGGRVPKFDPRPETYGTLDEATSFIGLARAMATSQQTKRILVDVQRDLYLMMAELAFAPAMEQERYHVTEAMVERVERETDALSAALELPPHFILPGDTVPGGALDVARAVVRRAERLAVRLAHDGQIDNPSLLAYLTRLSSLLFIQARFEDREAGITSTPARERRPGRRSTGSTTSTDTGTDTGTTPGAG